MNRWVVSSQVLTQSYSVSIDNSSSQNPAAHLPVYSSIHPIGHATMKAPPWFFSFTHMHAWMDRQIDRSGNISNRVVRSKDVS